jgi:hypothetical protein
MRRPFYYNKRGGFFSLGLVLITILMIGVVIYMYFVNQSGISGSLVSPVDVMKVGDDLKTFEMLEQNMIREAYSESAPSLEKFRSVFLSKVESNTFMVEFVLDGLVFEGNDAESTARANSSVFLNNILYPEKLMKKEGDAFMITRRAVGKRDLLEARNTGKVNFPVSFSFEFEQKYLINKKGEVAKV